MGAFYVDQKKKDLLPSTLPSEHEQWGFGKTARTFTLPISTQWSKVVAFHNGESPDTVSVKTDVVQSTFTVKTLSGAVDAHYISIGK